MRGEPSPVNQRGFSLIELLVVLVIISIITGLATVSYISAQKRGRDAQRKSDLSTYRNALELFFNDYNRYPCSTVTSGILPCDSINTVALDLIALNKNLSGGQPLKDPRDTVYYLPSNYSAPDNPTTYNMYVCLENTNDPERDATDQVTTGGPVGLGDRCTAIGRVSYTKTNP